MRLARRGITLPLGLAFGVMVFLACQSTSPQELMSLAGPLIPGAEYVGMELCAECHEDEARRYQLTSHFGTSIAEGEQFLGEACESCHGAGSLHVESRGDPSLISRVAPERCFVCHLDKRAEFQLQYHHPVVEGWVGCASCHDPHGDAAAWSTVSVDGPGEVCFQCHKEQKGPFVFDHDPMRTGCQECHNPHGSVYPKLLVADGSTLCLRCHWEVAVNTGPGLIGSNSHSGRRVGTGEDCLDCHSAPHGSNIDPALQH